ncbi:MAG: hypothetical protein HYX42_04270 [Polaromonas sp.]|uniref:hypothetical protein n=1 Tax=Polaromonas sp. TaxID=1869339 RepID=UPI0025E9A07B|nr:hypothetical protein [Polaromonas sp.]MBI2725446.1 hypothetical protein [Polaromonas sp.]
MTPHISVSPLGSRRHSLALIAGAALACTLASRVLAADTALPVPPSLPLAAQTAAAKGEPLVLLISLPGCPYCELVRRSYLLPMRAEGLQAWQINITDRRASLTGFDGKPVSPEVQAGLWKATFTPTVLFLGPQGQMLAPPLVGIAVPDFYGAYLDERLATARKALAR